MAAKHFLYADYTSHKWIITCGVCSYRVEWTKQTGSVVTDCGEKGVFHNNVEIVMLPEHIRSQVEKIIERTGFC